MSSSTKELVFSRNAVEFAAVAKEYCAFIENISKYKRSQFVRIVKSLLPLLYYKASLLPATEPIHEEGNQKFVTEEYYEALRVRMKHYMGEFDAFPEVFDKRTVETDDIFSASLSEYFSDIYQDLKDFTMIYQKGQVEEMNDALWECSLNFQEFWGLRLANSIRAVHQLAFGDLDLDQADDEVNKEENSDDDVDTSNWIISRRQNEMDNEEL
jgi:hypothetical protein